MENEKNEGLNSQEVSKPKQEVSAGEPRLLEGPSSSESKAHSIKTHLNPYVKLLRDFKDKHKADDVSPTVITALSSANMRTLRSEASVSVSKSYNDIKKKNI